MAQLIFDEKTLYNDGLFKFEERLHTPIDRYIDEGAILVRYYSQDENASTVDRGIQDIDSLFGSNAPIRYNCISDFPLYSFTPITPENAGDENIEDFNAEGDCIILPSTIIPKPWDFFVIQHLKQLGIFSVREISYDSMKPDGYYKIHYKLQSTSREVLQRLDAQVVARYNTELSAIGTRVNPVIREDEFILRSKTSRLVNEMISSYRALFYNDRHNCFLYFDPELRMNIFDQCGNEFMAKHSLMNIPNSNSVVILHDKLYDTGLPLKYMNSVYHWMEMDAPLSRLQKFHYDFLTSNGYSYSSFTEWMDEVLVIEPINLTNVGLNHQEHCYFPKDMYNSLSSNVVPNNPYERLLWTYIHHDSVSLSDVPDNLGAVLMNGSDSKEIWMYTPLIIFILKKILSMP